MSPGRDALNAVRGFQHVTRSVNINLYASPICTTFWTHYIYLQHMPFYRTVIHNDATMIIRFQSLSVHLTIHAHAHDRFQVLACGGNKFEQTPDFNLLYLSLCSPRYHVSCQPYYPSAPQGHARLELK